jgi:hypothetical protein
MIRDAVVAKIRDPSGAVAKELGVPAIASWLQDSPWRLDRKTRS